MQPTLGGMGSAIANSGSAKLAKVFLYASTCFVCATFKSSKHTRPATVDIDYCMCMTRIVVDYLANFLLFTALPFIYIVKRASLSVVYMLVSNKWLHERLKALYTEASSDKECLRIAWCATSNSLSIS